MNGPIKRFSGKQVVTSPYGPRWGRFHRGVDLRSMRFLPGKGFVKQWRLQDVVATEDCEVLRYGTDDFGNDYIVLQGDYYQLKYIHVDLLEEVKALGKILKAGEKIGKTQLKGSSQAHHLHFEVWRDLIPINPVIYFELKNIRWKLKKKVRDRRK